MRQHETEREQEIACSMRSGAERLRGRLYRDAGGHSAEAGGSSGVVEGQTNLTILRASEAVMSAAALSIHSMSCLLLLSFGQSTNRVFVFFPLFETDRDHGRALERRPGHAEPGEPHRRPVVCQAVEALPAVRPFRTSAARACVCVCGQVV